MYSVARIARNKLIAFKNVVNCLTIQSLYLCLGFRIEKNRVPEISPTYTICALWNRSGREITAALLINQCNDPF